MRNFKLVGLAALTVAGLVIGLSQAQSSFAFGPDNECTTLGDCQGITCTTNTTAATLKTGDTAVVFGNGGGGVASSCGNGNAPNLSVVSANTGGLAFASSAFNGGEGGQTTGPITKASADGAGSLAGAQAFNATAGISTTAGNTGLAIASAVNAGNAVGGSNGAFGLSAFGGETLAAPNVTFSPGQTGCVSVGNAISSTFTFNANPVLVTSSLCVGNHVVIAGQ